MATVTKRGPHQYQAIVRKRGYLPQIKTFGSLSRAKAWARDVEAAMEDNTFVDRRAISKLTLHDLLEQYVTSETPRKRGHVQERNRIRQLQRHAIALRSMDTLSSRDFAAYRDERIAQVSAHSVRLELALLSHLYTIAIKEWCLPLKHELKKIRKPSTPEGRDRRLQGDEEARLFAAIDRPGTRGAAQWLKACVALAIQTGMRAGEILSASWEQVDLDRGCIRLQRSKNGSKRTVPLTLEAVRVLNGLPREHGRVVPNFHDTSGLDRAFKRACKAAGLEDLRFHDLRHEAASRLAQHMRVQDLAKVLGWTTLQMAMRYYNPTDDELVRLVRQSSPAANSSSQYQAA